MWSLGCIFAEMLGGRPVFNGSSTLNQIEKIFEFVGVPEDLNCLKSSFAQTMVESSPKSSGWATKTQEEQLQEWKRTYSKTSDDAAHLLCSLMQVDPANRLQAHAGLTHPYCQQFHDEESEITASEPVQTHDHSTTMAAKFDDNKKLCAHPHPPSLALQPVAARPPARVSDGIALSSPAHARSPGKRTTIARPSTSH